MSENKTLSLNISERVSVLKILDSFQGRLSDMKKVLEDVDKFSVSADEFVGADVVYTDKTGATFKTQAEFNAAQELLPRENRGGQLNWNDDKGGTKEIEINDVTLAVIKEWIKEKDEKGEFSFSDKSFITLQEKLA